MVLLGENWFDSIYDFKAAEKVLFHQLYNKHKNWTTIRNRPGASLFRTKKEALKFSRIKVIPSLILSKEFAHYKQGDDLRKLYVQYDYVFHGIVYIANQPVGEIIVDHTYIPEANEWFYTSAFPNNFYQYPIQICKFIDIIFWDKILSSYCYFDNTKLYVLNKETYIFEDFEFYITRDYGGIDNYKKAVLIYGNEAKY